MPENIRKGRNLAIGLGAMEFLCCIAALGLCTRERSGIVTMIIFLAFLSSIGGSFAKLVLSWWGLLIHATLTIAAIGGFYIYSLISFFFRVDHHEGIGGLDESFILFLLALPLFFIFLMGIYSLVLLLMVDEELDDRKK